MLLVKYLEMNDCPALSLLSIASLYGGISFHSKQEKISFYPDSQILQLQVLKHKEKYELFLCKFDGITLFYYRTHFNGKN